MAEDKFASAHSTSNPATRSTAVVPNDATGLAEVARAIYVGTGGTIVMRGRDDTADRTWKNVPSGALIAFRAAHVKATGTTAADMLALY